MPLNHNEIIEDLEGNIRKFGGGFGEWCVGTAKDSRGPVFRRHLVEGQWLVLSGEWLVKTEAILLLAANH